MRSVAEARDAAATTLRRTVTLRRDQAAAAAANVVARLVDDDRLQRDADVVRLPGASAPIRDPTTAAAMDRLEEALSTVTPPALAEAAIRAGCPADAVRALERSGRIVVLDADLAFAAATYQELAATAVRSAAEGPLTPAAYRDAIGSSRKYVMAILEDLDRRGVLRRTPAGHLPGPRPNALADPRATSTVR
jgi:selenocysteine-specific elongation factor